MMSEQKVRVVTGLNLLGGSIDSALLKKSKQ